ncbi:MAG: pyrroline-5-carboxylate reductase [Clostridia bacterium]|nr:pyrroline-5-carboxylate reductase [Clostridia bacterium]
MEKIKVGFIGCGNMGGALALAVAKSGICEILLSDTNEEKAQALAEKTNGTITDTESLVKTAKYIFLGVKPQMMESLIEKIAPTLKNRTDRFILVTMAAGIKISSFNDMLGAKLPIIRIMPNTPVAVGEGMILYAPCKAITEDEEAEFKKILEFSGRLDKLPEELIDAGCSISGCGPAFVYMFCESMAKAGVELGLDSDKAVEYAAQTLLGAARLLLTSGKTPEELRTAVCSPNGSTIEGVEVLQNSAFDKAVNDALKASFKRTKELGG